MGLLGGGAIGGAYAGQRKARNANKAQKRKMQLMREALNQFKAGSMDALGNKLSANAQGLWSYDLNNAGKAARNAANYANYKLGTTADKSAAEIARDNLMSKHLANTMTARANQAAAMRSGARTNSNLGRIADSFSQAGSQRLRDNYMQGIQAGKNAVNYNAQMRQNLAQAANAANQPIQNIQRNLQNMVNGLNGSVMRQYNNIASAVKPKEDRLVASLEGADKGFNETLDQLEKMLGLFKTAKTGGTV